jgi:hypothetical protein
MREMRVELPIIAVELLIIGGGKTTFDGGKTNSAHLSRRDRPLDRERKGRTIQEDVIKQLEQVPVKCERLENEVQERDQDTFERRKADTPKSYVSYFRTLQAISTLDGSQHTSRYLLPLANQDMMETTPAVK